MSCKMMDVSAFVMMMTLAAGYLLAPPCLSALSIINRHTPAPHYVHSEWQTGRTATVNPTDLSDSFLHDPPQCQKLACPPAKLVADRGSYRKVYFPVASYAKSRLEGETMVTATLRLYRRLRGYIMGDNEKEEKLPMTAPVILRVDSGEGGLWSPKNFTLFFFIHPSVKTPPAPTDDSIEVLDINSYTLYIRTFSGYPVTYADWMKELLQLAADVEADGEIYTKAYYYFASYDPPAKMTSRINEVQLLKPHP